MDEKGPWSQIRMAMLSIEADLERAWCVWAVSLWAVSGAPAAKKISLGGGAATLGPTQPIGRARMAT